MLKLKWACGSRKLLYSWGGLACFCCFLTVANVLVYLFMSISQLERIYCDLLFYVQSSTQRLAWTHFSG
jgi:hypothetical protein